MDVLGFKLQNIKNSISWKKVIKKLLILSAIILFVIIIIIAKKNKRRSSRTVKLISNNGIAIKKDPVNTEFNSSDSLDVSVYGVIDNTTGISHPVINRTQQDIDYIIDQQSLKRKIDEINNNDTKNNIEANDDKIQDMVKKTNIKVNKPTTKSNNLDELKKLGNSALINNLKQNKDIKPGIKVQLMASKNKQNLLSYWDKLKVEQETLFLEKNYYIEESVLNDNSSIYRLQVGTFDTRESANQFCQEYIEITHKTKMDCIILGK